MNMTHYQNTEFNTGKSVFIDTTSSNLSEATFTAKAVKATINGSQIPMVRAEVMLRREAQYASCGNDCDVPVVESCKLSFNVTQGADNLTTIRGELIRLVDEAIASYGLSKGLVPPSYAKFEA